MNVNRESIEPLYVMHKSKLPYRYWFITMHLLTSTKKSFSAKEKQRQLGHNGYALIWQMVHKLRLAMCKPDDEYILAGSIELNEGFFSTEIPDYQKQESLKRGRGSQKQSKLLVSLQKMKVIDDLKKETINAHVERLASDAKQVNTEVSTFYVELKNYIPKHNAQVIPREEVGDLFPWVHIAISKARR